MGSIKVLFTIAGLHPESGGPSRSVPALCEALGNRGVEVEIVSLDYGEKFGEPLAPPAASVHTTFVACKSSVARRMQWTPRFTSVLRERCRATGAQLVHDTGLWLLTNHAAARICGELKLPRVVSPRGMLTAWALRHKGWKKRVAWALYQRRDLQRAQVLHATSQAETENLRAVGLRQPIALIPNGVDLPPWRELPPRSSERRTLLFLGRIHPVKGLLDLVEAWAIIRPRGWRVVIAGRDEGGHQAEVQAAVRDRHLEDDFQFIGAVDVGAKWATLRSADLLVLPSHSENFGMVVAEALACGVPAIAARGTPWADLRVHQCGWWADQPAATGLAEVLRDALDRTDEERRKMGARGRQWAETKFGWPGLAAQMHSVYRWILGEGPKPECIIDDGV